MSSDEFPFTLLAPPESLSEYGDEREAEITYIGETLYISGMYHTQDVFGVKRVDRNRHMYILGKSGMGKSYLMEQLIREDIQQGFGIAVIDPHKDLSINLLKSIPEHRIHDVVYVDGSDMDMPLAFNPFANVPIEHRQQVAQGLVEIFKKQFASNWSHRIEHLFRFATLAMLEYEQGTLYGLLELITNAQYRQQVLQHIDDEVIKRFFSVEFAGYSQKYEQEAISPLSSRLGHFFSDPIMRNIFTNPENKINIDTIMNEGKILIINTAKGLLGEANSALFGSFFLTKIEQASLSRAELSKENRTSFYLYVDEFQNVATESFISLFSESRKYNINITVANQYLSQIQSNLMNAILGNVGIMVMFRLGGQDAKEIATEFEPELKSHDFLSLGVGQFYIKMSVDGKTTQPFSATTRLLPPPPYPGHEAAVLQFTKAQYRQAVGKMSRATSSNKKVGSTNFSTLPPPV
jgi:DNA helicase HerA-like ATPase